MKLEAQMNLTLQRPNRHSVLERNPISLSQTGRRGEEGLSTREDRTSASVMREGNETKSAVPQVFGPGGGGADGGEHVRGVKAPQRLSVCLFSCPVPQPEA